MFHALWGRKFFKTHFLTVDVGRVFLLPAHYIIMKRNVILLSLPILLVQLGCQKKPAADVRIKVVMKKYTIDPPVVRVKSGEVVALDVTSADVQHGLDIPELGIKKPVQPGAVTTVTFTAPAKGEYRIACGVICGPHHEDMTAKLVVE
jgi:heme/copper-type cytochrome/quinol oxidase subunit 2